MKREDLKNFQIGGEEKNRKISKRLRKRLKKLLLLTRYIHQG
jgi:hypothetical protein